MKILYGEPVVASLKEEIVAGLSKLNKKVKLALVGFSDNQEWQQYAKSTEKQALGFGIEVEKLDFPENSDVKEIEDALVKLNNDSDCRGILLQQPLRGNYQHLAEFIDYTKDIDGITAKNRDAMFCGRENIVPATPLAVIKMLEHYNIDVAGKKVAVLGRGTAVGRPLCLMLLNRNATPVVCHTKTKNISEVAKSCDIVVSCCGSSGLVTKDFVTEGSIVVDVGLSFVDGKTRGDVAFQEVCEVAFAVSPVPKGIGPVTRACLFLNLINTASRQ